MSGALPQNWMKIGGICLFILLITYGVLSLEARQQKGKGRSRPTTYSTTAGGYKALYLWVRELGIPFKRWERPFGELTREASVLFLATPEMIIGTLEMRALDRWVKNGGTLVLALQPPHPLLAHFDIKGEKAISKRRKGQGKGEVLFQPGPYTQGVREILPNWHRGLQSRKPEVLIQIRDSYGGLLAAGSRGKGQVIALADPGLLANLSLRKGDHARLALNLLLTHRGKGLVLVDEYYHGYGRATSVFGHLARSHIMSPLIQALILLIVFLAAGGRRFGRPRPMAKIERRSSMEYVRAMAQIYQRAHARLLALEGVVKWVESEARRMLLDHDKGFQQTMKEVRQWMGGAVMTDRELLGKARGLYRALAKARGKALDGGEGI